MKKTNQTSFTVNIPLSKIKVSPHNDGRGDFIDENGLQELAESIKSNGVLQAVIVRPVNDYYELVIGERRFRASKLAGKKEIKAEIKELSDEQVLHIQLIENFQREQPHPMVEARGFHKMMVLAQKPISAEEISSIIGKSKTYVYLRLKLNDLIDRFQNMFLANKLNTNQALLLARLDKDSQNDFFNQYCIGWKENDFHLRNFNYLIENFELDLSDAPFDISSKTLDKKAGACITCISNTATTTSLFPEQSDEARCTNRICYNNKCKLTAIQLLNVAINLNPELPLAVSDIDSFEKFNLKQVKGFTEKTFLVEDVDFFRVIESPEIPILEDFNYYDTEEENLEAFNAELEEYHEALETFEKGINSGKYLKAICADLHNCGNICYLQKESASYQQPDYAELAPSHKAKDFQEAIKTNSLTEDLITAEKDRLIRKEERSLQIDQEKIQIALHEALKVSDAFTKQNHPCAINDRAAMIFLLLDNLGYSSKRTFTSLLSDQTSDEEDNFNVLDFCYHATDNQLSLLIRHLFVQHANAKNPNSEAGQLFQAMLDATEGIDTSSIRNHQYAIAAERKSKLDEKLQKLDQQLSDLA